MIEPKFVGPGLQVYGLATPLNMTSYDEDLLRSLAKVYNLASIKTAHIYSFGGSLLRCARRSKQWGRLCLERRL